MGHCLHGARLRSVAGRKWYGCCRSSYGSSKNAAAHNCRVLRCALGLLHPADPAAVTHPPPPTTPQDHLLYTLLHSPAYERRPAVMVVETFRTCGAKSSDCDRFCDPSIQSYLNVTLSESGSVVTVPGGRVAAASPSTRHHISTSLGVRTNIKLPFLKALVQKAAGFSMPSRLGLQANGVRIATQRRSLQGMAAGAAGSGRRNVQVPGSGSAAQGGQAANVRPDSIRQRRLAEPTEYERRKATYTVKWCDR